MQQDRAWDSSPRMRQTSATLRHSALYPAALLSKLPQPEMPFGIEPSDLSANDKDLTNLRSLGNLQALNLRRALITSAGLKELTALRNLRWLDLAGTKVTDAGLKELARLKKCQWLYPGGTKVTDAGVEKLRKRCRTAKF